MSDQSADGTVQRTLEGDVKLVTDETIVSACVGTNADLFPRVLALHVERGATVADVTYGKGTFWNKVPSERYDLQATDIDPEKSPTGESVDCRNLPYGSGEIDAVVLDPPYSEGFYRGPETIQGNGTHAKFRRNYSQADGQDSDSKYHDAVRDLYHEAGREAARVLRVGGTLIVKTQDEVSANENHFTHIEIANEYRDLGLALIDLFVLVQHRTPSVTGMDQQIHARKNHSYFMVFEK